MAGDPLTEERNINFTVVFETYDNAANFCNVVKQDMRSVICEAPTEFGVEWEVTATTFMAPSVAAISEMEERLAAIASPLGGRNDGWGCFSLK